MLADQKTEEARKLVLADLKAEEARKLIAKESFDPAIELLATALELRCMPALFEPCPAHTTLLVRVLTRTPSALQYRGARRRAQRLCWSLRRVRKGAPAQGAE